MVESSLALSAAAQLAPLADYLDLDGHWLLADDPFDGAPRERGVIALSERPGLGAVPARGGGRHEPAAVGLRRRASASAAALLLGLDGREELAGGVAALPGVDPHLRASPRRMWLTQHLGRRHLEPVLERHAGRVRCSGAAPRRCGSPALEHAGGRAARAAQAAGARLVQRRADGRHALGRGLGLRAAGRPGDGLHALPAAGRRRPGSWMALRLLPAHRSACSSASCS